MMKNCATCKYFSSPIRSDGKAKCLYFVFSEKSPTWCVFGDSFMPYVAPKDNVDCECWENAVDMTK